MPCRRPARPQAEAAALHPRATAQVQAAAPPSTPASNSLAVDLHACARYALVDCQQDYVRLLHPCPFCPQPLPERNRSPDHARVSPALPGRHAREQWRAAPVLRPRHDGGSAVTEGGDGRGACGPVQLPTESAPHPSMTARARTRRSSQRRRRPPQICSPGPCTRLLTQQSPRHQQPIDS